MKEFYIYYNILRNVNATLKTMLKEHKKKDLYIILPEEWRPYLFEKKTILGLEIKYNHNFKSGIILKKNDDPVGFLIPECAKSNGTLN